MAIYWYTASADTDGNNANNYYPNEDGSGVVAPNLAAVTGIKISNTSCGGADIVFSKSVVFTSYLYTDAAQTGGTDAYTGNIRWAAGITVEFQGPIIGSAGADFQMDNDPSCVLKAYGGLTWTGNNDFSGNTGADSVLRVKTTLNFGGSTILPSSDTISLYVDAALNFTSGQAGNAFHQVRSTFQINCKTVSGGVNYLLTYNSSGDNLLDCTINGDGGTVWIGGAVSGTTDLGSNFELTNFTGSMFSTFRIGHTFTITSQKNANPTFTGVQRLRGSIASNYTILPINAPSANVNWEMKTTFTRNCSVPEAGVDIYIGTLAFTQEQNNDGDTYTLFFDNFTSPHKLYINGNIDLTEPTNFTLQIDKNANATVVMQGASRTVTFKNSVNMPNMTIETSGDTDFDTAFNIDDTVIDGDLTTDYNHSVASISGDGGSLKSASAGTERTITATNTGVADNCTFQDIHMNAANKVNAKTGGTNNGNTKGIVFADSFGGF